MNFNKKLFLVLFGCLILLIGLYLKNGKEKIPHPFDNTSLEGKRLYKTIEKYVAFGEHRTGTKGDKATIEWMAKELEKKAYKVDFQEFITQQFFFEGGNLLINKREYEFFPQWWIPTFKDRLILNAPLVNYEESINDYQNQMVFLIHKKTQLGGAYFEKEFLGKIETIAAKGAVGIIAAIENKSGEIYAYNVTPTEPQLPIPVLVVAPKRIDELTESANKKALVELNLKGHYKPDLISKNVIASIGDPKAKAIIISTTLSGWFTNAAERGPGIAVFLGLAVWIQKNNIKGRFVFVATGGHELTHIGADKFIKERAPKPVDTKIWIHLGASLTAFEWEYKDGDLMRTNGTNINQKICSFDNSSVELYNKYWKDLGWIPYPSEKGAVGEAKDIQAYGYPTYIGFGGLHTFFHTPKDQLDCLSPELLEVVGDRMLQMIQEFVD